MGFWLRSCPRCGGDLFEERALGSVDMVCIQCGHVLTAAQEMTLRSRGVRVPVRQAGKAARRTVAAA